MFYQCFAKSILNSCGRTGLFGVAISFLLCIPGCGGDSGPRMAPVSGTVTVKGKAIEGVEVYFVHEKRVTMGATDSQGHYELAQGAVVGDNKVYFSKSEAPTKTSAFAEQEGMDAYQLAEASGAGAAGARKASGPKQIIPAEYSNANEPKLDFPVPSGGTTTADFKL